jgi:hypothetical protein
VHFLDAWLGLSLAHLLRSVLPAALVALAVLVPGRQAARLAALGVAVTLPFLPELAVPGWVVAGWVALWLVVARQAGLPGGRSTRPGARLGGLESGIIGLVLGIALLVLVGAGVARLDQGAELTRRAAGGVLLVVLGLVHLMLRRHAVRAVTGFAAMGLGLQLLDGAVRAVVVGGAAPAALVLLVTALSVVLALRVGHVRAAVAGSAWVGDAHDLHD